MIALPNECLAEIFVKLNKNNLFPCLFVNRHWCRNVVPILWSKVVTLENKKLIRTFLLALNAEEQAPLIPFKVKLPNGPKLLFDYTSYITSINVSLCRGIVDWFNDEGCESRGLTSSIKRSLTSSNKNDVTQAIKYSLITMLSRTTLNLQKVIIDDFIEDKVMDLLIKSSTLSHLSIFKCDLGSKSCNMLAEALYTNRTLTHLCIASSKLYSESEKSLVDAFCKNTTLTSLTFHGTRLGAEKGKVFAEILCKNTTLTDLNLYGNKLGFEGVNALADALCENDTLTTLNLGYNNINIESVKSLAKVFYKNAILVSLNLSANCINSEGGKILAEALFTNTTLTSLNLSFNSIDSKIISGINKLLERNKHFLYSENGR